MKICLQRAWADGVYRSGFATTQAAYELAVADVFSALDNGTIVALGDTVREHVQATFNRKAALHAEIAAAVDQEALDGIDINTGW